MGKATFFYSISFQKKINICEKKLHQLLHNCQKCYNFALAKRK